MSNAAEAMGFNNWLDRTITADIGLGELMRVMVLWIAAALIILLYLSKSQKRE